MNAKFTVREPVDFIALAPVVLGFQPTHSLVMMTIDSFHARIDVPDHSDVMTAVSALLEPAKKHNVNRVAFIIFDEGDHPALRMALKAEFSRQHIEILAALHVVDGAYREFFGEWKPLDLSDHPLTLEAMFQDRAPQHASRDDLKEYVKPCGADVSDEVTRAVATLALVGISDVVIGIKRETARESVKLWTEALRGCESGAEAVSDVAVVLAFSAWLSGDGALAWVALDQAASSSNWHMLLTETLMQAISPEKWDEMIADV
jgi:hypothetical protein